MVRFLDKSNVEEILNQKNYITNLLNSDKKLQKLIVSKAGKKIITPLCIIVLNILRGSVKLSDIDYKNLKRFKLQLRNLVKRSNLSTKKKILQQGGFLSYLLPVALTTLDILSQALQK